MTIGSLFSGIGGLELGLERAGLGPVLWQCELDRHCRAVLYKRWPRVPVYPDIRTLPDEIPYVDIVCGGFRCQGLSDAARGRNAGLEDERSGLWFRMLEVISEIEPRYVIVENIDGAGRMRWLPAVRRSLHEAGYSSVSFRLRACDVGAPFLGARVFVLATPYSEGESTRALHAQVEKLPELARACWQDWGQPSPAALGVADGVPRRMERLRMIGNAVVPQVAEALGRAVLDSLTTRPNNEGR